MAPDLPDTGSEWSFVAFQNPRKKLRVLDLFSGIGGFSLGLERTGGFETVAFCEIEAFPRKVLAKHWPDVPCYDDVRTLTAERLAADGIAVDVITGGFPCQDVSMAGNRVGIANGTRSGLYAEVIRLARDIRPAVIVLENVTGLLSGPTGNPGQWFGQILADLDAIGYDAVWHCIPLGRFGAPHERDRVWIVAYAREAGLEGWRITSLFQEKIAEFSELEAFANAEKIQRIHSLVERRLSAELDGVPDRPAWSGQQWPETEPLLCRVDDGIPDRVGRTEACGNAVGPIVPELIGNAILAAHRPADEQDWRSGILRGLIASGANQPGVRLHSSEIAHD